MSARGGFPKFFSACVGDGVLRFENLSRRNGENCTLRAVGDEPENLNLPEALQVRMISGEGLAPIPACERLAGGRVLGIFSDMELESPDLARGQLPCGAAEKSEGLG